MAVQSQTLKDVLICPICMEIFREPVTTPCQHNFCRECIQSFAEISKAAEPENADNEAIISCPMCREPIKLGDKGMVGLPVNRILAEIVQKCPSEDRGKISTPLCFMCKDSSKASAVKFCSTCSVLYCQECLSAMHPMRGPLKRHNVISVQEFLTQCTAEERPEAGGEFDSPTVCEEHTQRFVIFCVTCEALMCLGCIHNHNDHKVRDIKETYETIKAPFIDKIDAMEETNKIMSMRVTALDSLMRDVQCKRGLHKDELTKAYNDAMKMLGTCYRDCNEDVDKIHDGLYSKCQAAVKEIQMKREDTTRMIAEAKDLLPMDNKAIFIKNVSQVSSRIDDLLYAVEDTLETQDKFRKLIHRSLKRDTVTPKFITVKETGGSKKTHSAAPQTLAVHENSISNARVQVSSVLSGRWRHFHRYWLSLFLLAYNWVILREM